MKNYVKGDMNTSVDGAGTIASSGTLKMTSEGSMYITAPNANIAADNISVFGASGFIGGSGVNIDGNLITGTNIKAEQDMSAEVISATTFRGDLAGVAQYAQKAEEMNAVPSATFAEAIEIGDNATIDPAAMEDYLSSGAGGVIDVDVDPNDTIKDMINLGAKTGGALDHPPTIEQIQAMLRDKSNRDNAALTNWLVENGYLSPTYRNTTPKGVKSVSGNNSSAGSYTPEKNVNQDRYTPVPQYDPNNTTGPNQLNGPGARSSTLVGEGVPLATFLKLGAKIETLSEQEKLQFARYAHIHATYFYNKYKNDPVISGNRLEIVMGLYTPPSKTGSIDPGGINDLAQTGRVAVYEVLDASGKQNLDVTFALASRIANKEIFDKLVLDYDTYESKDTLSSPENPFFTKSKGVKLEDGGIANVKLIVILPEFGSDYVFTSGRAKNETETLLNGESQGKYLMNLQLGTSALDHDIYKHGLVQELIDILAYVGNATGLRVVTGSGDRGPGGSGRHNKHAADVDLYLNGRKLNVNRDEDVQHIKRFTSLFFETSIARGFNPSVGIGTYYMGGDRFHYDIAVGRVPTNRGQGYWGNDEISAGAVEWLGPMFNQYVPSPASPIR